VRVSRSRRRGALIVITLTLVALAAAVAAASTQSRDDASDAPAGPLGEADLRTVGWDIDGSTAKLTIALDASTYQECKPDCVDVRAQIGVHTFLDTDSDDLADAEVVASRNSDDVRVDVQVRTLERSLSTDSCQDLAGKPTSAAGTVTTTVAGGLETFSFTFDPTVVPGSLDSFRWAVFAQAPPDPASGGPWDLLPNAATVDTSAPNPGDVRCNASKSGLPVRIKDGVVFPDPVNDPSPTATAQPSPPSKPSKPVAVLQLPKGQPKPGTAAVLDATSSKPSAGQHIVAYQWDMNGDGTFDTNTARDPVAHLIVGSAAQTVVVRVVDSAGLTDVTSISLNPPPSTAGCQPEASIGVLRIRAACIRRDGEDLVAEPGVVETRFGFSESYMVSLNGVALVTADPAARVRFDMTRRSIRSASRFRVMVLNGPQGDLMFADEVNGIDWPMPAGGGNVHGVPARVLSFQVSHRCNLEDNDFATGGLRPVCATVPGGFPLTGEIGLGIDTTTYDAIFDVQITVGRDVTGTAGVRLRASIVLGSIVLDRLRFEIAGATIGPVTLVRLAFRYEQPGTGSPLHEGDLWDVTVFIATSNLFTAEGRMIFIDGQFNYMSADLSFEPGILVYPAVFLNRFAAVIGVNPFRYGGGIGANFANVIQVNANFLYAYLPDRTVALRIDGTAVLRGPIPLASAYSEIWSNGYMTMGGGIGIQYPRTHPWFTLVGRVDMWFEAQPDNSLRWQGTSTVRIQVGPLDGSVVVFLNNDWMAGCFDRFTTVAYNWASRRAEALLGCDLAPYRFAPLRERPPLLPPAQAAQATPPRKEFSVAKGQRALVLGVDAAAGSGKAPKVTLTDPSGRVYTPSDVPDKLFVDGGFRSFWVTGSDSTLLRVENPVEGTWTLTPQPGSVAIDKVRSADSLPPLKVSGRVTGKGRTRTLTWRASGLAGRTIRFTEHGKNTGATIVETKKARGRVRFDLQDGSAGSRKVEAQVAGGGFPVAPVAVARVRAPGPMRPGRPGKVKAKRRGDTITLTWPRLKTAKRFRVTVNGSDGRRELFFATAKQRLVRVLTVRPGTKLTIRVSGSGAVSHAAGPTRTLRYTRR